MPGAHSGTHDLTSLGIALVGGLKKGTTKAESNFTPAQYLSLQKLLARLGSEFPDAEVLGCRDLPGVNNTASPSFDVREWLRRIDEESTLPAQD
jgi:N-acetylmuramoyl-L-alanine amidase